jgi:hypothetical protein
MSSTVAHASNLCSNMAAGWSSRCPETPGLNRAMDQPRPDGSPEFVRGRRSTRSTQDRRACAATEAEVDGLTERLDGGGSGVSRGAGRSSVVLGAASGLGATRSARRRLARCNAKAQTPKASNTPAMIAATSAEVRLPARHVAVANRKLTPAHDKRCRLPCMGMRV